MLWPEAHREDSVGVPNPGTLVESCNYSVIVRAQAMNALTTQKATDKS